MNSNTNLRIDSQLIIKNWAAFERHDKNQRSDFLKQLRCISKQNCLKSAATNVHSKHQLISDDKFFACRNSFEKLVDFYRALNFLVLFVSRQKRT